METNVETTRIAIFDTTLRDGEQSPGCSMNLDEKAQMAAQLERLGVDIIEAGFPVASEGDFNAVRLVSETCEEATIAALCRTVEGDVLEAAKALKPAKRSRIHTFVATSDIHMEYKLKKSRGEVLEMTKLAVHMAKHNADEVEFSADDFIVEEDNVVIVSRDGWVKRQKEVRDLSTTRLREGD